MLTYSVLYPAATVIHPVLFRHKDETSINRKIQKIDWSEVSRFCFYGGLFHAPLVFNWLRLAARLFPKDTFGHLAAKVAMDQTMFAPVALSAFYIGLATLEGKNREEIYKEWIQISKHM